MEKTVDGHTCRRCRGPDTDDMVQCDKCDGWHHYGCVGVTDEVADQSWSCANCKTATWNQRTTAASGGDSAQQESSKTLPSKRTPLPKQASPTGIQGSSSGIPELLKPSAPKGTGKELYVPKLAGLPTIRLDEASSIVSCTSSQRSARNRAKLQLQRLEEERAFEQQQAERRRAAEQLEAEKHREFLERKYKILDELASDSGSSRRSGSECSRRRVENWIEKECHLEVAQQFHEPPAQQMQGHQDQRSASQDFEQRQHAAIRMSKYFNPNI